MLQADVANRICRPTCERFFASVDHEIGEAQRQDQVTLRLCHALFTCADEIGATYHELFSSAAIAALEVAYKTGHSADDIVEMLKPKLDELTAQLPTDVQAASAFGRTASKADPRVLALLNTMLGETVPHPTAFDILHAAANALLLVVRDTAMSADATISAVRRLAQAGYVS